MDTKRIVELCDLPRSATSEDIYNMMEELQKRLDLLNQMAFRGQVQECKRQYTELLTLAGELNDILNRE